jgi:hypothetical protein
MHNGKSASHAITIAVGKDVFDHVTIVLGLVGHYVSFDVGIVFYAVIKVLASEFQSHSARLCAIANVCAAVVHKSLWLMGKQIIL